MKNIEFFCDKLGQLLQIEIICAEDATAEMVGCGENNPTGGLAELAAGLMEGADAQELPYLYKDAFDVCFGCMRAPTGYILFGPMSLKPLAGVALHRYYRHYRIREENEKALRIFPLTHVLGVAQLLAKEALERIYSDEELLRANQLVACTDDGEVFDETTFEAGEEEHYHHTYEEERKLLDCVREGDADRVLWHTKRMDLALGRMSVKELNHWKNAAVAAITLCTRAAIDGGVAPSAAYRISDRYIQKCDGCSDIAQVQECRNRAVQEITERVRQRRQRLSRSNYVEQCRDYVENHYREKIHQEDIAAALGISSSYLSRLFHRETGIRLQDYIMQIRVEHAANLLKYSNESIASIAEYVNFPSQSYMGRVFKEQKHMSPGEYRKRKRMTEFAVAQTVQR